MVHRAARDRDERGQSISLFVLVIMGALIITTGLVIDGGQKVAATSRAESAAAGAGRAAGNAAATQQLGGADGTSAAVVAAKTYLAGQPGVDGTVSISNGVVLVTTSANEPTILLSVIGISSVSGQGSARAKSYPPETPDDHAIPPIFGDETNDDRHRVAHDNIGREGAKAEGSVCREDTCHTAATSDAGPAQPEVDRARHRRALPRRPAFVHDLRPGGQ